MRRIQRYVYSESEVHLEAGRDPEDFAVDPEEEQRQRMRLD